MHDDRKVNELHWSTRYSLMGGVQADTLLLIGTGDINGMEAVISVLNVRHLWSIIRSNVVIQNLALKSMHKHHLRFRRAKTPGERSGVCSHAGNDRETTYIG